MDGRTSSSVKAGSSTGNFGLLLYMDGVPCFFQHSLSGTGTLYKQQQSSFCAGAAPPEARFYVGTVTIMRGYNAPLTDLWMSDWCCGCAADLYEHFLLGGEVALAGQAHLPRQKVATTRVDQGLEAHPAKVHPSPVKGHRTHDNRVQQSALSNVRGSKYSVRRHAALSASDG